jgi:4'-phosphopantetheinyl transferase
VTGWTAPRGAVILDEGTVHVWRVPLDPPAATLAARIPTLSADERRRGRRIARPHERRLFLATRVALRAIVALYLDRAPDALTIVADDRGKPRLADDAVAFNLAHDGDLALVALARDRAVGVDVERIDPALPLDELAPACLSQREREWLGARPAEAQPGAFTACWVAKEAYLKARGVGLAESPHLIEVADADTAPSVRGEPAVALTRLEVDPGRAAALAVEGEALSVVRLGFTW